MKEICPICRRRFLTLKKYREEYQWEKIAYDSFLRKVNKWMFPQEAILPTRKHKKHYVIITQSYEPKDYSKIDEELF
jgi:hypothetical protein